MKVVYQGKLYHNNFWTLGDVPSTHDTQVLGSGQPWTSEGTCLPGTDGGTTSTGTTNWSVAGNTIVDGNFIGTINSKALVLKANNLEGLFVNPEKGSVSIGKPYDPYYYKFEVNGGLTAFTGPNQTNQNNILTLYSGNKSTARYGQGFTHYLGFSHGLYATGVEYAVMNAYEYNSSTGAGFGKHLIVQNTNEGNLGVGVYPNPPDHKLCVNGNLAVDGNDFILGRLDGRNQGTILTNRAMVHNIGDDALVINYEGDFEGGVRIAGKGLMVRQVCVNLTLDWCDYVFEENYKLMSLKELKKFINRYHHLPEIPSARELEKDGLNLNNMVTLQMKKIEELTLYTIEQDQKIDYQQIQIKELQDRLLKLESLYSKLK